MAGLVLLSSMVPVFATTRNKHRRVSKNLLSNDIRREHERSRVNQEQPAQQQAAVNRVDYFDLLRKVVREILLQASNFPLMIEYPAQGNQGANVHDNDLVADQAQNIAPGANGENNNNNVPVVNNNVNADDVAQGDLPFYGPENNPNPDPISKGVKILSFRNVTAGAAIVAVCVGAVRHGPAFVSTVRKKAQQVKNAVSRKFVSPVKPA